MNRKKHSHSLSLIISSTIKYYVVLQNGTFSQSDKKFYFRWKMKLFIWEAQQIIGSPFFFTFKLIINLHICNWWKVDTQYLPAITISSFHFKLNIEINITPWNLLKPVKMCTLKLFQIWLSSYHFSIVLNYLFFTLKLIQNTVITLVT